MPYIADDNMETLDAVFREENNESVKGKQQTIVPAITIHIDHLELETEWLKSGNGLLDTK